MTSRRRTGKACARCRKRKERCDGLQPTCSPCLAHASDCVWSWQPKKRGLKEGWVRMLEKLLALAMLRYPDLEQNLLEIVRKGLDEHDDVFTALWTDHQDVRGLWKVWTSSVMFTRLEVLVRELEVLPPRELKALSHPFVSALYSKVVNDCVLEGQSLPTIDLTHVERYFLYTQGWMPVVERQHIYRLAYRAQSSWQDVATADACCLSAVVACSMLASDTNNDQDVPESSSSDASANFMRNEFDRFTLSVVPKKASDLRFAHVQALLMLSVARMHIGAFHEAWLFVGQAHRIFQIALMQEEHVEKDRMDRIRMGCFIIDNLLSARLHVPPHCLPEGISQIQGLDESGWEEWCPASAYFKFATITGPMRTNSCFNGVFRAVSNLAKSRRSRQSGDTTAVTMELTPLEQSCIDLGVHQTGTRPMMLPSKITVCLVEFSALLNMQQAGSPEPFLNPHPRVVHFMSQLKIYVSSVIEPVHIPVIWEPILMYLLDQLEARATRGETEAQSSIDRVIDVVSHLQPWPVFQYLKARCTIARGSPGPSHGSADQVLAGPSSHSQSLTSQQPQQTSAAMQNMPIPDLEIASQLVTTTSLEAEIDWDLTLQNLGFTLDENGLVPGAMLQDFPGI